MYVLDTNVISEFVKPNVDSSVLSFMYDHEADVFTTSIAIQELYYGVLHMAEGRRQDKLHRSIDAIVRDCANRTLAFDAFSGFLCGELRVKAQQLGRGATIEDLMIAVICKRHDAVLVTRNVKDFDYLGIDVMNPFEYESPTLAELKRREQERQG
ncbi:MAG: type II toxin-antitoxin system VapC family toxin [Eggerthellaceae bacterium]|nr:type II toxin-antitoxin system VapC family toxin [Eggerthellaceae bacterium]